MKRFGIHARLLVPAFLLIGVTTFALGYMGVSITQQFAQERFQNRILFLAETMALNAELGILIDDRAMLNRQADKLLARTDMVGVRILDGEGRKLIDASKALAGPYARVEAPVLLKTSDAQQTEFPWESSGDRGKNKIGSVQITYSLAGIDQLLITMRNRFVWTSVALGLLSVIIFYFISRSLVAPVRQLAQAARQVARGDLELRVQTDSMPETQRLAQAFNAMLDFIKNGREALEDAYQEMVQQKTLAEMGKFSMMIAHEVKNPLGIIKSSLDILKKDLPPGTNDTMVGYIEDEVHRLNLMIEDFLMFSRPARPNFRRVDVNALMEQCVMRYEIQAADTPVKIESKFPCDPCYINVDSDLLVRAGGNIIKNALEANSGQGMVKIDVRVADNAWTMEVADEGSGVDPENMNKIFEPFFTTRSKGTGLGLAFASQVITAHRGSLTAANRDTGGALFKMELPIE